MRANALVLTALAATAAFLLASCASSGGTRASAVTKLQARSGSTVSGSMRFTESRGVLRMRGTVNGLAPGSEHGFHIHEKGDCSAPDASSAGGHFNPAGSAHGKNDGPVHHAGDLPSLKADARGVARIDAMLSGVTLADGPNSIRGRSLVVHANADDFTTQPSGNSGPRVACGPI